MIAERIDLFERPIDSDLVRHQRELAEEVHAGQPRLNEWMPCLAVAFKNGIVKICGLRKQIARCPIELGGEPAARVLARGNCLEQAV